jgi:hypothetical protein
MNVWRTSVLLNLVGKDQASNRAVEQLPHLTDDPGSAVAPCMLHIKAA